MNEAKQAPLINKIPIRHETESPVGVEEKIGGQVLVSAECVPSSIVDEHNSTDGVRHGRNVSIGKIGDTPHGFNPSAALRRAASDPTSGVRRVGGGTYEITPRSESDSDE